MNYRWWILIAIFLFSAGLVFGLMPLTGTAGLSSEGITALQQLSDILLSLPLPLIALFIFFKNASALLISFALSPILCLAPVLALTFNGLLLGSVSAMVVQEKSVGFVLAALIPHGIFELPAFIIGEAAALSFGAMVILALFRKEAREHLVPSLKQNLKYLAIAFGLLVPAAIIETYVTPLLLT
jgi:stage II sporulation protein M